MLKRGPGTWDLNLGVSLGVNLGIKLVVKFLVHLGAKLGVNHEEGLIKLDRLSQRLY